MHVFFYNRVDNGNLLSYETSSYNNIPRIGEKVIIEKKWYLVEDIINIYTKPADCIFTVIYVYLKVMED